MWSSSPLQAFGRIIEFGRGKHAVLVQIQPFGEEGCDAIMTHALPSWTYDEFAQVGIDFADSAQVEAYDRRQGNKRTANRHLLAELGVGAGHVVIDLGTGTGALAIEAAQAGAIVHAVDVSSAMLEHAQRNARMEGVLSQISFHHAGFLTYRHPPQTADFVFSQFALHHLPDFWKQAAISRIAEALRPGGCLYLKDVVFSFEPEKREEAIEAWLVAVSREDDEGWSRADFESHVRDENSTFAWILEGMLKRAGFAIEKSDYSLAAYAAFTARKK
jgi:putative AdoMet-dependent methyltransferase